MKNKLKIKMKNIEITCPQCKSKDIGANLSGQVFNLGSFINQYKCNSCGFVIIFTKVDEK